MTNHLEIPFFDNGNPRNATVQLDGNGATITIESGHPVFIERRSVEAFIGKWNEIKQGNS